MPRIRKTSEKELLRTFSRMIEATKSRTRGVVLGVGDDAAVIRPKATEDLLVTADVLVEGRHFERQWFTGFELGWRLAAVNLSDIAAMGGRPRYGILSLVIPGDVDVACIRGIERGVRDHLSAHGAVIVGGNVSGIEDTLVCDLTLVGSCARNRAWRRTCRPGRDSIVVVGYLGDARAGLDLLERGAGSGGRLVRAFKKPTPLLDVAGLLTREKAVHGAIDVSDGFSTDLIHICENSGAGCEVDLQKIPVSRALRLFAKAHGHSPLEWALHGGEDYALVLSVDSARAAAVAGRIERSLGIPARVVGRFTGKKGSYRLVGESGRSRSFSPGGWDHLARPL